MTDKKLFVYTDGSCINNGKKNCFGAIGIFFTDNDSDNLGQAIDNEGNKVTNQTMELLAVIQALKIIDDKIDRNEINPKIIVICTDSTYIINSITKWYGNWIKNNWKNSKGDDVENKDLIQLLHELKSKYITIFKHIRSHQSEPSDKDSEKYCHWYGNNMADKLATNASKQYMNEKLNENIEVEEVKVKSKSKSKKIKNSLNV